MEMTRKGLCAFLFLAILVVSVRGKEKGNYSSTRTTLAQTNVTSNTSAKLPKGSDQDVVNNKKVNNGVGGGGGGGGGGGSWGWGGGGGGGGGGGAAPGSGGGGGRGGGRGAMGGGGGWGWGGGGGGWWGWGCRNATEYNHAHKKRQAPENQYYKVGEFAQCVMKGRCQGIRLDCPLHCGGPCFYDCKNMCKAHCRR